MQNFNSKKVTAFLFSMILLVTSLNLSAKETAQTTSEAKKEDSAGNKMDWWNEAKFGMFIHWGLYSVAGNSNEWHMRNLKKSIAEYSQYAGQFNPTLFNANEWAELAREAGMKYMVITTKHHDGFALFKSEASSYNMVDATPYKRDVIKELAEACPRHDIRLGLYYSLMADWGHPGGGIGCPAWDPAQLGDINAYFDEVAYPQVEELLTNYGPVAEIWFDTDGPIRPSQVQAERVRSLIQSTHPDAIVNNRVIPGDFSIAERHIPAQAIKGSWEGCDLIINGSWGYFKNYRLQDVRSLSSLIRQLIDVVSKGGNMLLNVGPQPDGTFPQETIERLKGIGDWMKVNGEAIYGTTAGPFDYLSWGRCTRKEDKLYLHIFNWPKEGKITVPLSNKVGSVRLLGDETKKPLKHKIAKDKLTIFLPKLAPDSIASVIAINITGEPAPVHSMALNKPTSASVFDESSSFAVDNDPLTAWKLTKPVPSSIVMDLQSPLTFNTVRIGLGRGKIKGYSVDYWEDGQWKPIFSGHDLPLDQYVEKFRSITSSKIRFNIQDIEASQEIWLNSFEIFDDQL